MSRLLPGAPGQTPGLFTGPRPQAWPPPRRPTPPSLPPAVGPSVALTRSSRGRASPWSAEAAAATAAGEGAGGGSPRRRPARSGRGGGGGGEEPGCVRAPGSRRPRGSDHPGVGAGGGERVREEEEPKSHSFRAPPAWRPPPPLPNHRFPSCSRRSTRSCKPGGRRDHSSLPPARAPAPSAATAAAAATSASPRRRALDGAVLPFPHASDCPAPPHPSPSAQPSLQMRRGGAAGETRMSLGRNRSAGRPAGGGEGGGGRGEGADDVTALPGMFRRSRLATPASDRGLREHRESRIGTGTGALIPRRWVGRSVRLLGAPGIEMPSKPGSLPTGTQTLPRGIPASRRGATICLQIHKPLPA